MKYILALLCFALVFCLVFFLAGWFVLPLLPPIAHHDVYVTQLAYWRQNWIGLLLGSFLGALAGWAILSSHWQKPE